MNFIYNITLLSSFHIPIGKCNPLELYKIIETINPEIIFEELPNDYFEVIYSEGYNPESLEAITIKEYLKKYPIKHFPVDTYPINGNDLFNGADIIAERNKEYSILWQEIFSLTSQDGFFFLNSNNYIKRLQRINTLEETSLKEINDKDLSNNYKTEKLKFDIRENEMLRNIYRISEQFPFNKALFICGAKHRKAMAQKILEIEKTASLKLNWTLFTAEST